MATENGAIRTRDGALVELSAEYGQARVPRNVLEDRWTKVSRAADAAGYDALLVAARGVVTQYGNVMYLSGFPLFLRVGYVFLRNGAPAQLILDRRGQATAEAYGAEGLLFSASTATDTAYGLLRHSGLATAISDAIRVHGLGRARIGVVGLNEIMPHGDLSDLKDLQPDVEFEDASSVLAKVKMKKSPEELQLYQEAAALVDEGFEVYLKDVAVGLTEAQLASRVEGRVRELGALPLTIIQVLAGSMYTRPATSRTLTSGEFICCYVEAVAPNGFWAEKGAMFQLGKPTDRWQKVYEASEKAFSTAEQMLRPGVLASEIAAHVQGIAREAGCETGIQIGHGVGIDHDIPVLSGNDHTALEPGMVISLHPHFVDGEMGSMTIDQYTITDDGPLRHSGIERELYVVR